MRLLVCGSRTWASGHRIAECLHAMKPSVVIHGAARGADELADAIAKAEGMIVEAFPADWQRDKKAAGPIRNARMLKDGKPDRGLAFGALWKSARASSKRSRHQFKYTGTGDMVAKMLRAGLPVRWVATPDAPAVDLVTMPEPPT
jgi:hypothetical protein